MPFTADFGLSTDIPQDQVPLAIERDRVVMTERPGMRQKHLPLRFAQVSEGEVQQELQGHAIQHATATAQDRGKRPLG